MKQQFTGTCSLRPARTEIPGPAPAPPTAQQWLTGILTGRRHRRRSRALLERVVLSEAWGSQGYRAESRRGERPEPPWPWWATETPEPLAKSPSLCARKDAPKLKQTHANRVHSSIAHSGREERVSRLWSSHTVEPRVCVCVCVCVCVHMHTCACMRAQSLSHVGLFATHRLSPASPWDFPGKNIGVGCRVLLQEIFQTQGSNPCLLCLLHWHVDSTISPHGKPQRNIVQP